MYRYSFFLLFALILGSCTEVITINTGLSEDITIVEGYIGADATQSYIKVSAVVGFYDEIKDNNISTASIVVAKNTDTLAFAWDDNRKLYAPTGSWSTPVAVGDKFEMLMQLNGKQYRASDVMAETAACTLRWRQDEDEFNNPETESRYYQVRLTIADNKDNDNYYYLKFFENQKQIIPYGFDVADDKLFDISAVEIPYRGTYFNYGDTVSTINYGISRNAYEYFSQANSMLQNDGGLFTPIPANPYSNIEGGEGEIRGFFRASLSLDDMVVIGDSTRWSPKGK